MTKSSLILLLMLCSCQCQVEPLNEVNNIPCQILVDGTYKIITKRTKEYETLNKGECQTGLTDNSDDITKCVGYIDSKLETCNGLDDDCNGLIDDNSILDLPYYNEQNDCNHLGVCEFSSKNCINGEYVCKTPDEFGKETCDNKDNDCDGEVDEDTLEDPIFADSERYVYTGDPATINIGECRAGYRECVDGRTNIRFMRTPTSEICGNGDDDDCDGLTDEGNADTEEIDFALIIDYSGSMTDTINSIADALCQWSAQGNLVSSRFAVIAVGYIGPFHMQQTAILTDFTDSGTACDIIRENNIRTYFGNIEQQLNATYNINDPNNIDTYLSWGNGERKVFIFSDENLQQTIHPLIRQAIDIVVTQCLEQDYIIGALIDYNTNDQNLWVELTQRCNGFLDYLTTDSREMIAILNYWISSDC
jgi:hypothetical protein